MGVPIFEQTAMTRPGTSSDRYVSPAATKQDAAIDLMCEIIFSVNFPTGSISNTSYRGSGAKGRSWPNAATSVQDSSLLICKTHKFSLSLDRG